MLKIFGGSKSSNQKALIILLLYMLYFILLILGDMEPILIKEKLSLDEVVEILQQKDSAGKDCQPLVRLKVTRFFFFRLKMRQQKQMIGDVTSIDGSTGE